MMTPAPTLRIIVSIAYTSMEESVMDNPKRPPTPRARLKTNLRELDRQEKRIRTRLDRIGDHDDLLALTNQHLESLSALRAQLEGQLQAMESAKPAPKAKSKATKSKSTKSTKKAKK